MSQIRLDFDEDAMRHALVAALQPAGVDVVTALEANRLGDSDDQQLV